MSLFFGTIIYFNWFTDPVIDRVITTIVETDDPNHSLVIREHLLTGEKEYIYGVVDGVGSVDPKNKDKP